VDREWTLEEIDHGGGIIEGRALHSLKSLLQVLCSPDSVASVAAAAQLCDEEAALGLHGHQRTCEEAEKLAFCFLASTATAGGNVNKKPEAGINMTPSTVTTSKAQPTYLTTSGSRILGVGILARTFAAGFHLLAARGK
jgi:hypothetical protein